jgi:flagellar M-ring protein FliF
VQVSKLAFDTSAAQAAAKQLTEAQAAERTAGYIDLGKKAALGLAVLVALVLVLRSRKKAGPRVSASASDLPAEGLLLPAELQAALSGARPALTAGPKDALPGMDAESRAARERMREELSTFVDNQPDEIAQLVQGWLTQRKG